MMTDRLIDLLPPPPEPVDGGGDLEWSAVEGRIGTPLPADYKDYLSTYGSGQIARFLWVYNPFSRDPNLELVTQLEKVLEALRNVKGSLGTRFCPYPIFPEENGLLPWGRTDNGDDLYWIADGKPEEWPVVIGESRSANYEEHRVSMTHFLEGLVSGELVSSVIPRDFLDQRQLFVPAGRSAPLT